MTRAATKLDAPRFIHVSVGGPLLRMRLPWGKHPRGRYLTFEDHRIFGPEWCRPDGEPLNRPIPAKSPFWPLYEAWCRDGKPTEGNRCIVRRATPEQPR